MITCDPGCGCCPVGPAFDTMVSHSGWICTSVSGTSTVIIERWDGTTWRR
jgi:hypothetical protein